MFSTILNLEVGCGIQVVLGFVTKIVFSLGKWEHVFAVIYLAIYEVKHDSRFSELYKGL